MKHFADIFFDFDDTLYDTHGNSVVALRKLYDERHWDEIMPPFRVFNEAYVKTNVDVWSRYTRGEIDCDTLIVERFRRPVVEMIKARGSDTSWVTPEACLDMSNRYGDIISLEPGIVDGARELVSRLVARGYNLHLCSNGFHEVQFRKLHSSGLEHFFSSVILSEDAGANKPRREFFDYAFRKTGAEPSSTILIGDNYNTDILGAMNYGLDIILFNRWQIDTKTLERQPTFIVNKLQEINDIL